MHEVLVNRLGGLSLPRKSVVRLTDRPDMTLDVYRGRKTTIQYNTILKRLPLIGLLPVETTQTSCHVFYAATKCGITHFVLSLSLQLAAPGRFSCLDSCLLDTVCLLTNMRTYICGMCFLYSLGAA